MRKISLSHDSVLPALASLALGVLLLASQSGCVNDSELTTVGFGTGTAPTAGDTDPDGGGDSPDDPGSSEDPDPTPTPDDPGDPGDPGDPPDGGDPPEEPVLSCGMVVIKDLRITTGDNNGPQIHHRPWADLELDNPNGSSVNATGVAPGVYERVRFTMHKRTGSGSDGPGTGNPDINHSIHLCGTIQGVEWDYTDDTTETVDRRDAGGVEIDGDGPAKLFIVFDSSHWFDGIDLTTADVAADGIVYLAHSTNSHLQQRLRNNIKESIHLANHAP